MPIKVVKNLPAIHKLAEENIFVMDTNRAESQNIRPLKILLVNLMPTKEV
ncbi:MAG: homoserine O-succinyltransferase, partial [Veillonella sp.]|nr:homoserine O-succinyltransferase [Veillonella sp.]